MQGYLPESIKKKVPDDLYRELKFAHEKYSEAQKAYGKCTSLTEIRLVDDWCRSASVKWEEVNKAIAAHLGEEWPFK